MPPVRFVIPGRLKDVLQRGNYRQVIFAANVGYLFFRDVMLEAAQTYGLSVYAFV